MSDSQQRPSSASIPSAPLHPERITTPAFSHPPPSAAHHYSVNSSLMPTSTQTSPVRSLIPEHRQFSLESLLSSSAAYRFEKNTASSSNRPDRALIG